MLTRLYFLGFLAFCLGAIQAYSIFDSLDNQESCPAPSRRREILNPQHRNHYNIQHHEKHELQVCKKPETETHFSPVQWLMRIIHIRGIIVDRRKQDIKKPRAAHREQLLRRQHALQNPVHPNKHAKMLYILKHNPELRRQPNHYYM